MSGSRGKIPFLPSRRYHRSLISLRSYSSKSLLAIKKITARASQDVKLSFVLPQGKHDLTIYTICDSYLAADRTVDFSVDVKEGEDSDEDDSDDDDEMEE